MCVCAKLCQSCLAFCNPMDCSLPDSSVHGILSRQEYWSGLPCPSPGESFGPGIKPTSLTSPALARITWEALYMCVHAQSLQ